LFFGLISGCTTIIADIIYPTYSVNKSMVLLFDYSSDKGVHSIYYRWNCSVSSSWAANTGRSTVRENTPEHAFVKKLGDTKYLYVSLPSCIDSQYTANVVEFDLSGERPKPKLVMPFVSHKECAPYAENWRVSNYRHIDTSSKDLTGYTPPSGWAMNQQEKAALAKIKEYEYTVFPIKIYRESSWTDYLDYLKILRGLKQATTAQEFWSIYTEKHPDKNSAPYTTITFPTSLKDAERALASEENGIWVFPSKKKESVNIFHVRKKHSQSDPGEGYLKSARIYGRDGDLSLSVFDPDSKTIADGFQHSECFY